MHKVKKSPIIHEIPSTYAFLLFCVQILMSVPVMRQTSVIRTLCAPTLMDPTSVAASMAIVAMVEVVRVRKISTNIIFCTGCSIICFQSMWYLFLVHI